MQKREFDQADLDVVRWLIKRGGGNPDAPGMLETPARFLKAWAQWTSGYQQDPISILKTFEHVSDCDSLVFQANIPTHSLCEHHMAPFFGVTHIGYIPDGRVVGLSKLSRLVDIFANRFQMQERLACNIADAMFGVLEPKGVGVVMQCRHLCMESRGVKKPGTMTITSTLRGVMKDDAGVRAEFMQLVAVATGGVRQV